MTTKHHRNFVTVRSESTPYGDVEMRTATFGKGRAKITYYRFFRDDVYIGYASNKADADVNWNRALFGATRSADGHWTWPDVQVIED